MVILKYSYKGDGVLIETRKEQSLIELVHAILETNDKKLVYRDGVDNKKHLLNSRHLFDLFIAGLPANQDLLSLLELSPVLKNPDASPTNQLLKDTIRYFISIFDSLHDGVLIADKCEIVRYLNKSFERISGAKFETLVGQPLALVRPGAKLGRVIESQKAMLGMKRRFGDIEYMTDMHPIFINEVCVGGITIARDITEIQQLQTKLSKYRIRYNNLLQQVNEENTATYTFADIIGEHPLLCKVKELARRIASAKIPVLIRGESGTGKELFAHAIHMESSQQRKPFVTVNCAAIPEPLLESELFGYKEGAFSGARPGGKQGLIAMAEGGTVFLDEIGDMNIDLQAKILRFIHSSEIQPLGSEKSVKVNVRVIAATNSPLEKKILEGKFREDLFYRLNASQIMIPSLRERKEDILVLAEYFLRKFFVDHPLAPLQLSEKMKGILRDFPWHGNIRELENTINFIGNITDSQTISSNCLPPIFYEARTVLLTPIKETRPVSLKQMKLANEKELIIDALERNGYSVEGKKKAAKELGISLTTLYTRLNVWEMN